jgi:hypothetical protein
MKLLLAIKESVTELLAIIIALGSFAFLFLLLFKDIPTQNKDIVNITIGFVLGSFVAGVAGYYFGSSKPKKNETDRAAPANIFSKPTIHKH